MIRFFTEEIDFSLKDRNRIKDWLKRIIESKNKRVGSVNYIFCPDSYLLDVNRQYLGHDYYTDIITFDNSETDNKIDADIYISVETVSHNAVEYGQTFENELLRVLAHGLLHLTGYNDISEEDSVEMRKQEDYWIGEFKND